ncbi:iron ABC transporter permease [Pyruvatibacter sp.]|uniref:FecCD family ABC transporter permease n=1 Tax=Pyruvatibacter sp. TaxID=1981328 RepID=UPI0032ED800F
MTRPLLFLVLLTLLAVFSVLSLAVGPAGVVWPLSSWWENAGHQGTDGIVFWDLRMPRTLVAILAGAVLGLCGAALQGLLRNPLADPALLGISGAGALGGVGALYFGIASLSIVAMPLAGLGAAAFAMAALLLLAGRQPPPATLILAGLAINALVGALTWLALALAPSPFAAAEALTWIMGTLDAASMQDAAMIAPFAALCAVLLLPLAKGLDALALGEDAAASLGVMPSRIRLMAVAGVALGTGAVGAMVGALAFVGLVVPHALRPLAGARPGALLLPSIIGGAVLTLAADVVLRTGFSDVRLQLGVLTSLLGAPVFLWLVMRSRFGGRA